MDIIGKIKEQRRRHKEWAKERHDQHELLEKKKREAYLRGRQESEVARAYQKGKAYKSFSQRLGSAGKQWLKNVEKGQREDPLGLFAIVGGQPKKRRRKKRR